MSADPRAARIIEQTSRPESRRSQLVEALARDIAPIDWPRFWAHEVPPEEWVVEPIVPAHRQAAVYSVAKLGKSLLALDIAAALATGRPLLGQAAAPPRSVVYLDLEMTEDDLRERLDDLGYGPDDDLSRLAYYQLPDLPALDTDRGGQVLEEIVRRHGAELVIVDTMARVVEGDEDSADTYRAFYSATGVRLKRLGVALLRLDHSGKDPARGQRGSSAKGDDVDVVFRLGIVEDRVVLTRTHSRVPWVPAEVVLRRETDPVLRHVLADGAWPAGTKGCADLLDELEVPIDATLTTATRMLKTAGNGRRRQLILAGLRLRRVRADAAKSVPGNPGTARGRRSAEPPGTARHPSEDPQVSPDTAVPGTVGNRSRRTSGTLFPSIEGTGPGTDADDELERLFAREDE